MLWPAPRATSEVAHLPPSQPTACASRSSCERSRHLLKGGWHKRRGRQIWRPKPTKAGPYWSGNCSSNFTFLEVRSSSKNKVREITRRHDKLEASVIEKLNQVIRGTASYFATEFSTCVNLFQQVDKWIRMRIRGMKFKRKCPLDNHRLKKRVFIHRPGLLEMLGFTQTTMSLS
jgi:hypothetical protein